MANPAISVEDLSFSYGDLIAVDEICFEVAEGEIFGFLGPNGAGKSTTVKILTGQLRPKSGRAELLGMRIETDAREIQSQIGVSFEISNLYDQMSAVENLDFFARLFDVSSFDAMALLRRVGLSGRERERVSRYSKGMRQRLMVARALVNTPKILFLDEPTDGLDPVSTEAIRNIILEERDRGATVFLTTHDMVEADKLSDRVAFIDKGSIVALDTPSALKQAYGTRALKAEVAGADGAMETREIAMDVPETASEVQKLFRDHEVVTVHSEEATLEDVFIRITGRGLAQ